MPGPHQIRPGGLPGPHQVPSGLLALGRYPHRHDLVQPQQPGQMQRVPRVGLDPVPAGRCSFDDAAT